MRKNCLVILVVMALVLSSGTSVLAEEGGVLAAENFSSKIIFTTDYVCDGLSYSDQDAAIQGSIDYFHSGSGIFLGLWGSSWDDGYEWQYYRIGISKDFIAGFNVDLSYYTNSEDEFFEEFYAGEAVADPRTVFTLSRTF